MAATVTRPNGTMETESASSWDAEGLLLDCLGRKLGFHRPDSQVECSYALEKS